MNLQVCFAWALVYSAFVFADPLFLGSPRPLVLWHGLGLFLGHEFPLTDNIDCVCIGDYYSSPGMLEFVSLIKDMHQGIFVHSVYINKDKDKDMRAGFVSSLHQHKMSEFPMLRLDSLEMSTARYSL